MKKHNKKLTFKCCENTLTKYNNMIKHLNENEIYKLINVLNECFDFDAKKYSKRSWVNYDKNYLATAFGHLIGGINIDKESNIEHYKLAFTNLAIYIIQNYHGTSKSYITKIKHIIKKKKHYAKKKGAIHE